MNENELISLKQMRIYLKNRLEFKKIIYPIRIFILFFLILFGFSWSHVNIYFYLFSFSKILIVFGVCLFTIYFITDKKDALEYWKIPNRRKELVKSKCLYSFIEIIIIFSTCLIIYFILYISGGIKYWDEKFGGDGTSLVSFYQPNIWEGLAIGVVFILTLSAVWAAMYWFVGRFIQIEGYNEERQIVKIKLSKFLMCMGILVLIFWLIFGGIDLAYIRILTGGSFEGIIVIKNLLEPIVHWIPLIEVPFLIFLNAIFYIDGRKSLRK